MFKNGYEKLRYLLKQTYIDIYALEEIGKIKTTAQEDSWTLYKSSTHILGHICELLKKDLGLIIWKIYIDKDERANTLQHLKSLIFCEIGDIDEVRSKLKNIDLSEESQEEISRLDELRKKYLAHNDNESAKVAVNISNLVIIVETMRSILNALCLPSIDDRVVILSDKDLMAIKIDVSIGLRRMIEQSLVPVNPSETIHN